MSAPDIDELIKRVNTLTLDKNRLRQKLNQLSLQNNGTQSSARETLAVSNQQQANLLLLLGNETGDSSKPPEESPSKKSPTGFFNATPSAELFSTSLPEDENNKSSPNQPKSSPKNVIAGVECATSCEDDLLYINELYKNRLEEYDDNWEFLQSKCAALMGELNALQKHYALLKVEKLDLEERLKNSCDEYDKVKSELQTVVVNYESQLSAMSEHLSMITSRVNESDNLLS